jgi:hypothetical protein
MTKQLLNEELDQIKNIQQEYVDLVRKLGEVELKISDYEEIIEEFKLEKTSIKKQITILREKDRDFTKNLFEKYGEGQINIETGEIS